MADYKRGDVWLIDFDPTQGHEQAGRRPGLIVSVDLFNQGPAGLVVVVPLTSKDRRVRWHVPVDPPEAGLKKRSFIMCENIRSVSQSRLVRWFASLSPRTLAQVEDRVRILLNL